MNLSNTQTQKQQACESHAFSAFNGANVDALMRGDASSFGLLHWDRFGLHVQSRLPDFPFPQDFATGAKYVEDSATAVYFLTRATSMRDVAAVLATFVRAITGKSIIHSMLTSDVVERFRKAFVDGLRPQSGPWYEEIASLRHVLDKFEMVRGSQAFKKIHSLVMYVLSFGIFEKFGVTFNALRYNRLEQEAVVKDFSSATNFFVCIIDTVVFICERGVTYMKTGRWTTFLHTGDKYEAWFEMCIKVREHSHLLNDPELHGFDEPLFVKDLTEALRIGEAIYEEAKTMCAGERKLVAKLMSELRMIKATYLSSVKARSCRDVPYSLVCVGESNIGKSQMVSLLISMYAAWRDLPRGEEYIYTLEPDDDFWAGFKTFMWALILDDLGSLKASLAEAGLDKMLMQLISIINTVPYVTNQAALEDKGTIPFRGKFVIATANTKHMNAQFVYQYPIAALRRLPIVLNMKLRPEYATNSMLDKAKARASGLDVPDFYDITVERVVPCIKQGRIDPTTCAYQVVEHNGIYLEDVGLREVLAFLRDDVEAHHVNQDFVRSERERFRNLQVCECHAVPHSLCMDAQVGEERDEPVAAPPGVGGFVPVTGLPEVEPAEFGERDFRLDDVNNVEGSYNGTEEILWEGGGPGNYGRVFAYRALGTVNMYVHNAVQWAHVQPYFGEPDPSYVTWRRLLFSAAFLYVVAPVWCWSSLFLCAYYKCRLPFTSRIHVSLRLLARATHVVINSVFNMGFIPLADYLVGQIVWPDRAMRRIYRLAVTPALVALLNESAWHMLAFGHAAGWRVCSVIVGVVCRNLPVAVLVYLIPVLGTTFLSHYQIGAILMRVGQRETAGFIFGRMLLGTVASLIAMRAALLVVQKLSNMAVEVQGGEAEQFDAEAKEPVPHEADVVRANVWYKDDYVLTPLDLAPTVRGMKPEDFAKKLSRQLMFVESTAPGEKRLFFRALGLTDNIYVTNAHNLRHSALDGWKMAVRWTQQSEQVSSNCEWSMDASGVKYLGSDIALFKIPVRPPVANVLGLLASRTLRGRWNGYRMIRMEDGSLATELRTAFERKVVAAGEYGKLDMWMSNGKPSFEGYCGAVYVVETTFGPQIAGIHMLGSPHAQQAGATALCREELQAAVDEWCPLNVQGIDLPIEVGPLDRKATIRYIETGHMDVYGSVPAFSANRSKVTLSCTARFFMARGYKLQHGPPVVRGWQPNRRALLGAVAPRGNAPLALIQMAVRDYVGQIVSEVPKDDFSVIHMVDERTAVLGMPGIPHMERLAMSTSAGYPFNTVKRHCIDEAGNITDPRVRAEIDRIKACYVRGERAFPIFNACYKDEPTPFHKIAANKTRVFLISNVAFTVVCRQLMMGLIRFFTSHRLQCEMAVGLNCHSEEWGELRAYLTQFGDDACDDGDFAGFDQSQGAPWVTAVFDVFTALAQYAGASPTYLRMLQCLKYDIAFARVNWFGTLVGFAKQNPSGVSVTTQINCVVISISMRCVLFVLLFEAARPLTSFRSVVALATYGDDSGQNIHRRIRDIYNHVQIARVYETLGFTYTMANKDDAIVPFRHADDLSFLKRRWRWDEDVQAWMAPLALTSIEKSLLTCIPSRSVCEEKRATDCLSAAVREMFHHGRVEFDKFRALALECAKECNLETWVLPTTFPTFEELQAQFYDASAHVYAKQGRDAPVQVTLPAAQTDDELLLAVQGGTRSKRVAPSLSHQGDPQSRYSSMSRLDSFVPPPDDSVRVDLSSVKIRPANTFFPRARDALKSHSRHLAQVNPNTWTLITRIESNTDCLCCFCRPLARHNYGCIAELCGECERIFAPTRMCPFKEYVHHDTYRAAWNRETVHPFYSQVSAVAQAAELQVQSGEGDVMSLEETTESTEDSHVVAHFVDHTEGVSVDYPGLFSDVRDGEHRAIAELEHFLSRPVLIDTINWAETDTIPTAYGPYSPWKQFFNATPIRKRLDNYSAIACTLKLKFVVNASPFYYGSVLAAYVPATNNPAVQAFTATDNAWLVTLSQLPHVWIYPSAQQGGEIACPFFYSKNWLALTSAETTNMGTLVLRLVNQLQSANGAAGAAVTIQIWAWAEDVKLMGPTINLAVQSGRRDEYSKKPVTAVASATQSVARSLSRVPIIGRAATAVGDVAGAIGDVASLFGFTKVPVIDPPTPMVPKPFANFASTDIGTAVEKLTLDTKNDLTVDPRIAGLPGDDELALKGLLARESYLCSFTFSTTNAVDDLLFAAMAQPFGMFDITTDTYPIYCPTPIHYFSSMFKYWRGPMVFRFKIVATPYHQGRIRFSFDPVGDISVNVPDYATIFNEVVDLAHTSDFEVVVPFQQSQGWCRVFDSTARSWKANGALGQSHIDGSDNGMIAVRAVTKLTAPVASSTISVQVFVRAGEEFEVGGPQQCPEYTFLTVQSGEAPLQYGDTHHITVSDEQPKTHPDTFLVHMGEKVTSLRQMINRTQFAWSTQYLALDNTKALTELRSYQNTYPPWYGYDTWGHHTANTQSGTPATALFNYCPNTPWHMAAACFAGARGGIQWHFNVDQGNSAVVPAHFAVTRHVPTYSTNNYAEVDNIATLSANNAPAQLRDTDYPAGGALTNVRTNTGLSVLAPFYNQYRFITDLRRAGGVGRSDEGSDAMGLRVKLVYYPSTANPGPVRIDRYFSAGPDFQFLFFLCASPYIRLSSPTPA